MRLHTVSLVCFVHIALSVGVVAEQTALPLDGKWEGALAEKRATGSRELGQSPQTPVAVAISTAGDGRYVASPRVDSYHGIWFELHEDLIQLAGRTRADEVAAGRA